MLFREVGAASLLVTTYCCKWQPIAASVRVHKGIEGSYVSQILDSFFTFPCKDEHIAMCSCIAICDFDSGPVAWLRSMRIVGIWQFKGEMLKNPILLLRSSHIVKGAIAIVSDLQLNNMMSLMSRLVFAM